MRRPLRFVVGKVCLDDQGTGVLTHSPIDRKAVLVAKGIVVIVAGISFSRALTFVDSRTGRTGLLLNCGWA